VNHFPLEDYQRAHKMYHANTHNIEQCLPSQKVERREQSETQEISARLPAGQDTKNKSA
jgi:hypothetical protein